MLNRCYDKYDEDRCKRPTDNECQERKLKDVETNVKPKLLVNNSKVDTISEEQPTLPLRRNACTY